MTFDEFTKDVASRMKKMGYTDSQLTSYFTEHDAKEVLKTNYGLFDKGETACAPSATAYCLHMMY